jgi:hypothetical protein
MARALRTGRAAAAPAVQHILDAGIGLDKVTLHRVQRHAQARRDLWLAHAMHAVSNKGLAAALGQRDQRGFQRRQRLPVHDGLGHVGRMAGSHLLAHGLGVQVTPMAPAAALCIQGHVLCHDDQIGGRIARPWGRTAAVGRPGLFSLSRLRMLCQPQPGVVHGITGLLAAARAARGSAQKVRIGPVEAREQRAGERGCHFHGSGSYSNK